ncbi:TPA: flagellar basal body P-ring formation protein FlgA [Legionella pneumophila subsp. pneumophila]|uniref:flagellar basal body P-ring formation chaperone FlgA n=1 Tax=Legionella sp. PATHC039 TaxID=2992042 RepID=UPI001A2A3959|nr:flagellar basal body P-ring formation chaperone FlgA [Legionella sp. PATHC039]MCW8395459.1 flagellar basal body P-ring formation chaperone FlgA [Legionella sp. PATHC039]HAT8858854.1 flagellar basal body P-ring formation protein FlgA [Legionella pneumophila subsp. pneumophila]HAT9651512.1 flagellar basal body P-ring formation protein FlgA [Legionella pneumophila subsp. pneumophila]HAT9919552.1 flagellar basal body P-ring formation protein FlgA [Legionella pneumophila subsp. pneumophila]
MKKCILSFFLIFASTSLFSESSQSLELLKNKIEQYALNELSNYTEGKIQVTADNIDPRLNLKVCDDNKLEVFNPYQTPMLNTSTMGIKCLEENNHWTLYIPVKITIFKSVLVAKRALLKGTKISNSDIYQTELDVQKLKQGYFTDSKELIGLVCKHDITPNSPLNPFNIELAKLVHKGEQVSIIAAHDNLTVSMDGIAMDEGALGDSVKVKNLSSKRIIEAQVTGKKTVKVTF